MQLDKLERNLLTMDMFNMIKQQNICVVMNNITPESFIQKNIFRLKKSTNLYCQIIILKAINGCFKG
jgi:hypothetical protein